MAIQVTHSHFTRREEAVSEIASDGLRLVEAEVSPEQLSPTAHVHAYDVHIYMFEGVLELHEADTGLIHRLTAGSKAVVPEDTLHSEYSPAGLRGAFGVSSDAGTADPAPAVQSSSAQ